MRHKDGRVVFRLVIPAQMLFQELFKRPGRCSVRERHIEMERQPSSKHGLLTARKKPLERALLATVLSVAIGQRSTSIASHSSSRSASSCSERKRSRLSKICSGAEFPSIEGITRTCTLLSPQQSK